MMDSCSCRRTDIVARGEFGLLQSAARVERPDGFDVFTAEGVELESGELIPADTVVISIGDAPDLDFLPDDVAIAVYESVHREAARR